MIDAALIRQLATFGCIGVLATLTHYFSALASVEWLALPILVANLIGYVCAVLISYFGHGLFTFRVKLSRSIFKKFLSVSVLTFLLSEALVYSLESFARMGHRVSLAIVVCVIPVLTFVLSKLWVYRHPDPPGESRPVG